MKVLLDGPDEILGGVPKPELLFGVVAPAEDVALHGDRQGVQLSASNRAELHLTQIRRLNEFGKVSRNFSSCTCLEFGKL